jgi:FlaG/FlaF family flagellin (archaellin)
LEENACEILGEKKEILYFVGEIELNIEGVNVGNSVGAIVEGAWVGIDIEGDNVGIVVEGEAVGSQKVYNTKHLAKHFINLFCIYGTWANVTTFWTYFAHSIILFQSINKKNMCIAHIQYCCTCANTTNSTCEQ